MPEECTSTLRMRFLSVSATYKMFWLAFITRPDGWARQPKRMGLSMLTPKSITKREPVALSSELSPIGPLSVKKRELFFSESTMELGPFNAEPSKSLITGMISILLSVTVWERTAWWLKSAIKDEP